MRRAIFARTVAAGMLLAAGAGMPTAAQEFPGIPAPILTDSPIAPEAGAHPAFGHEAAGPVPVEDGGPGHRHGLLARWKDHHRRTKLHLQESALGFPVEFHEPSLGHFVYAHGRTQVANADAAQMVLYDYDFIPGTDQLSVRGHDRLARIASQMPATFFPLVIEWTPRLPGLDLLRRQSVLASLAAGPFPVPAERVVIGPAMARDLSGTDAELINQNLMIQTMTNGTLGGVGGGAIGGTSGQGFGSSGPSQPSRPR